MPTNLTWTVHNAECMPELSALMSLRGLGRKASEVADSLGKLKIRASKGLCPLENFLLSKGFVSVNVGNITFRADNPFRNDLPKACSAFVSAYDNGAFPELRDPKKKR